MKKNIVFIPIETISRELDAKLVLAHQLVDSNTICFLGQHDMIDSISLFFKEGVYVGKNIFKTYFPANMKVYKSYKKNKHSILWIHEEGGIYPGEAEDWRTNLQELLDPSCLEADDQILTWGDFQQDYYNNLSNLTCIAVGSPRLNLAKEHLLRKLINKFNRVQKSDFILINTNFSVANYISNINYLFKELMHGHDNQAEKHKVIQMYAEEQRNVSYFIETLSELAFKHPNETFVIRPHPTEGIDLYESAFMIYPNVIISKDFTAVEWIEKCKALIQNGCTTSIEAYLIGKKVINFYPFESKSLVNVTRDIGIDVTNINELESAIFSSNSLKDTKIINEEAQIHKVVSNLKDNYDDRLLVSAIKKAVTSKVSQDFNEMTAMIGIYFQIAIQTIIKAIKYYPRFLFPQKQLDYEMAMKHYAGMKKIDVIDKMDFLSSESQKQVDIKFLSKDLVMIYGNTD